MSKDKKSRAPRKRQKNFIAIPFRTSLSLSTLAVAAVLAANVLGAAFGEDIWLVSLDWNANITGLTVGQGPLILGINHADLDVGEIQEAIDAEVTDPDDIIAKERARRPVRRLGIFSGSTAAESLNDGVTKRNKIMFSVGDGHNLEFHVMNISPGSLTTGSVVTFTGTLFGRWQR